MTLADDMEPEACIGHRTLDQFPEVTSVTITGPDGIEHEIDPKTAFENLEEAA